jgi:xeroderma pigmentosum group C-complementing protein
MNMNLSSSSEEDDHEGYSSNDEDIAHILKQQDRSTGSMNSSTRTRTTGTGTAGIHTRTPAFITNGIHICSKFKSSPMSTNHAIAKQSDLTSVPVHVHGHVQNSEEEYESDAFDDVDWEDASVLARERERISEREDEMDGHGEDSKMPPAKKQEQESPERRFPSKDVIIHFNAKKDNEKRSREATSNIDINSNIDIDDTHSSIHKTRKKRRRINKIQNVPQHMQNLLRDLQRAHVLASISRSIFLSSVLGSADEDVWSIAYSLVPSECMISTDESQSIDTSTRTSTTSKPNTCCTTTRTRTRTVPTYQELKKFSLWFFDFVNNVEQRRQRAYAAAGAAGAPRRRRRTRRTNASSGSDKRSKTLPDAFGDEGEVDCGFEHEHEHEHGGSPIHRKIKRILAYLSPTNTNQPQEHPENYVVTALDKILVFICMARSMGWRVRFVTSLQPITRELTVDHPIFLSTTKNTFHAIAKSIKSSSKSTNTKTKTKKRRIIIHKKPNEVDELYQKVPTMNDVASRSLDCVEDDGNNHDFVWAEVLCSKTGKNTTSIKSHCMHRWTHIDPSCSLFDQPLQVEAIDRRTTDGTCTVKKSKHRNKTNRHAVSYVIGVEHFHHLPDDIAESTVNPVFYTTRLVDITPRYANKWSLTLKKRGANSKEIASGKCANKWWSRTLKRINNSFLENRAQLGLSDICLDKHNHKATKTRRKVSPYKIEKQKINEKEEDVLIIDDSSGSEEEQHGNHSGDDLDDMEQQEFASAKEKEAIPTSKASFKNHPLYVIPSVLKSQEVLAPGARKRICGIFKGEMVYKRIDASKAYMAKKWLYNGRKVQDNELPKPAKIVKARKKPIQKGFQALSSYGTTTDHQDVDLKLKLNPLEEDDGNNKLYGIWQTKKWSPPYVGPNDKIPVNDHRNVELELLNPGLVHLELYRIAKAAKQLGVPYAPCLLGFEGHGGNRTPTIRGIVVHEHNADLLREAHVEMQSQLVETEYKERQREIYGKWKRLIKGMMTKERLAREYAND